MLKNLHKSLKSLFQIFKKQNSEQYTHLIITLYYLIREELIKYLRLIDEFLPFLLTSSLFKNFLLLFLGVVIYIFFFFIFK